ncbi:MAG: PilZ domain-containing protein [Gammaproteobacteria bacterium]|nr:MAG: PilZ domain-containing protein [Gammaproteobacteria bacterium]
MSESDKQRQTQANDTGERRHFRRLRFGGTAEIAGVETPCEVLDLSLKGVLLARPGDWEPRVGDGVEIAIRLEDCERPIRMEAEVTHMEPERIGLRCARIDLEGISLLRRLVELNLADPQKLERELGALVG